MKFFLAPMQGLTGYIVRNAFHHHFDYIDKYYTPFIPAAKRMNAKIKRDIDPVNNDGITLIPQAMSIVADEVIDLHRQLVPYGYDEINVNLGCPSGTVVSKKRGSGILAYPDMLDSFLDELYTKADFPVSIKTRVGFNDDDVCRHNVGYWKRVDYIGFGLGASTLQNPLRYKNTDDLQEYLNRDFSKKELLVLTKDNQIEETLFLGLRMMEGVSLSAFEEHFHCPLTVIYQREIQKLTEKGLLRIEKDRISLTEKGIDLSNMVLSEFLLG